MTEPNIFTDILCFLYFHFRRTMCFFAGCREVFWSENEYISGEYCERCMASRSRSEGNTPFKMYEGNIFKRNIG